MFRELKTLWVLVGKKHWWWNAFGNGGGGDDVARGK